MWTLPSDYLQLTKPTIMLLVLFTGATALVAEGSFLAQPGKFALVLLALYLTGGCANALNQYFERDIDAKMKRTANRRPLPMDRISAQNAFWFAIAIGVIGVAVFAIWFNLLSALLAVGTILFYSLFYTLWLKPNTVQNIVIGGIAGAMAPVGAWAAATGGTAVLPWLMFLIVFLWTPPHFWALALFCKDDYVRAQLPMMPVVKGDIATLRQIVVYSVIVALVSLGLKWFGSGWPYFVVALVLGAVMVLRSVQALRRQSEASARRLFGFSIIYLFALFTAIMVDSLLV
ncbi:MAG: protoheme IX farnesyltransferase [candidate division Zixibacteria bacterium]|nr:protoheme IX farnesyltransferase [candidate division Zixibacteria bacterium]